MPEVKPTLLIGLGGTGKEVLLRIRRYFYEAGFIEQPRWISYLWIDTAVSKEEQTYITFEGKEHTFDDIARRTVFQEAEKCDIGLKRAEIDNIKKPENKEHFKNIWEWMEPGLLERIDQNGLTVGANQMPPLGRLALFGRANEVVKKLRASLDRLNHDTILQGLESAQAGNKMPKQSADDPITVSASCDAIIVGSLAGGTGAGLCIDIAAMLKAGPLVLSNTSIQPTVWGYFVLPAAFLRDAKIDGSPGINRSQLMANGYAMLQEIEMMSLVREGAGQLLTAREKSGVMKATWLYPSNPDEAPEIRAPLFHAVTLFDGHGDDNSALKNISDSYALVSYLLYSGLKLNSGDLPVVLRTTNVTYRSLFGHTEIFPPAEKPNETTKWCDVFSFRFATAGFSRVSYEAPRLQMMAAYALVSKALHGWMGEPNPRLRGEKNAVPNEFERRAEKLRQNVEARLAQEFQNRVTDSKKRWLDVFKDDTKWSALDALRQQNAPTPNPGVFSTAFNEGNTRPPAANTEKMTASLIDYYLTGTAPRVEFILRDIIDHMPLAGWDAMAEDRMYGEPGGVAAVDYAINQGMDLADTRPVIQRVLTNLAKQYLQKSEELKAKVNGQRADLQKKIAEYNNVAIAWNYAKKPFELVKGETKRRLNATAGQLAADIRPALTQWLEDIHDERLCAAFGSALDALANEQRIFKTQMDVWNGKVARARSFLKELLERKQEKQQSRNQPGGVDEVLKGLRDIKPDSLTIQLGSDIQKNPVRLWDEIELAYAGDKGLLNDSLQNIQEQILERWRGLLYNPNGSNEDLPPQRFAHLVDLAAFPRLDKLNFDIQMDALVSLGRVQRGSKLLLANDNHNVVDFLREAPNRDTLLAKSRCRLELRAPQLRRNAQNFISSAGMQQSSSEHHFVVGPAGDVDFPDYRPGGGRLEAYSWRFEFDLPLPSVKSLESARGIALSPAMSTLHFFQPKNGYPPIHAPNGADATDMARRSKAVLMALVLGQFRVHGGEFFDFMLDSDSGWISNRQFASLPDIVRHLGAGGDLNAYLDQIENRNTQILHDLSPIARIALKLILEYNERVVTRYSLIELDADDGTSGQQQRNSPGPQNIVLKTLLREVDAVDQFDGDPASKGFARDLLADFMHHFSYFVPINPRSRNSTRLLCLSTEMTRYCDLQNEGFDLLMQSEPLPGLPSEIHHKFALKAPWVVYSQKRGLETLAHHEKICGRAGISMCPPAAAGDWDRPRPRDWDSKMYINEAGVRGSEFYPSLMKKMALKQLDSRAIVDKLKELRLNAAHEGVAAVAAKTPGGDFDVNSLFQKKSEETVANR